MKKKSNLKLNNDKSLKKKPERKPESPSLVFIRIQDSLISDSMKNTADHDPLVPELWSLIPPLFVRFCKGLFSDFLSTDSLELTFKKRSLKHIEWPYWEVSITHYLGVWSLIPHLCNIVPVTWQLCATPYRTSKTHRMDAATLLIVTDEDRDPQNNNAYLKVRRLNEVAGLWCFFSSIGD